MKFIRKAKIMDETAIARAITRISHEILEKNKGSSGLVIVGIRNRGAWLAQRVAAAIKKIDKRAVPVNILDITLYRDDLTTIAEQPQVRSSEVESPMDGKRVVLVDDVLYTGRTVRCALDELIDFARPKKIQLAVLVDRGHRELPIRPDFIGKNVPTASDETVQVRLKEVDGVDEVVIERKEE